MCAPEIMGLIGPNGAGKSTMFNLVTGVLPVTRGEILFRNDGKLQRIDGLASRDIVRRGIARTFQHVRLMPTMSVLENVAIGAHLRGSHGDVAGVATSILRANRVEEQSLLFEAKKQLERVGLGHLLYEEASSLALGQQRILEIARALCCDPTLLLLDEAAAGLRYKEKQALAELLKKLKAEGMSILLAEQNVRAALQVADYAYVLETGDVVLEGPAEKLANDPKVIDTYLGLTRKTQE